MQHWLNRAVVALLFFFGVLMGRGGFWPALAIGAVSVPLNMLAFTWPVLSNGATIVFLVGFATWVLGVHILP